MSRKLRFIAFTLAVLLAASASAQAAGWTVHASSRAASEEGMLAGVWEWLVSWLTGAVNPEQGGPIARIGADTSHLDPNGGH